MRIMEGEKMKEAHLHVSGDGRRNGASGSHVVTSAVRVLSDMSVKGVIR
jgi:hypothetical protein